MRRPETLEDLDRLEARARTPDQHRETAARLCAWADERPAGEPEVTATLLLVAAGEHLSRAGDHEAALGTFRRAVATGGQVAPDVRCYLHKGLVEAGDADGARRLADELRREHPADGEVYLFVGKNYELAGDLHEAHRWLTMGVLRTVRRVEDGDDDAAGDAAGLALARLRVRHAPQLPMDEYDTLVASALLQE